MDPLTIKFLQLAFAELLGAALCLLGVYLLIRGLDGKSTILVKGPGASARITNASPGVIIALVGLFVVFRSLDSSVTQRQSAPHQSEILRSWLTNSTRIDDATKYNQVIDTVVGKETNTFFKTKTFPLEKKSTLSEIAQKEYGDSSFWRLVAAINKDRGYYVLSRAKADTSIAKGKFVEVWHVSIYNGMSTETRVRVGAENKNAAYDALLDRAKTGRPLDFGALSDEFKDKELELAYTPVSGQDIRNLREASLRYYGNSKYWPLIPWTNPDAFPLGSSEETPLPKDRQTYVIQFLGWPR